MGVFEGVFEFFSTMFNLIFAAFSSIGFFDFIDILVVAFIIYKAIEFFKESMAQQLVKGIFILFLVWVLASWFELSSLKWLLIKVFEYGIIALALIFQPELRKALERVGRSKFKKVAVLGQGLWGSSDIQIKAIEETAKAVGNMQSQKIGSLIIFEKETLLGDVIDTGTIVDAEISSGLLSNIFFPKSPLHDGAIVIRNGRIAAAGCILPLTSNSELNKEFGTRHRAGIGMSEESDAVVVIVSEETGKISVAVNGSIKRDFNTISLREYLIGLLVEEKEENKSWKDIFKKNPKKS